MKTLITGANGLLGTHLIKELIATGETIVGLYRSALPTTLTQDEIDQVQWVKGDILDVTILTDLMGDCERVYHCAGLVSFNPKMASRLMKINVEGTANVVNAALACGVKKLIHVSSVAAIGRKRNNETVSEQTKWDDASNPSVYGKSKYLGELEVWRAHAEGLDVSIVNPVIILGLGDWSHGSSAMFKNAYNEFPWFTEGISGFVDAADVAKAMVQLMNSGITGERFILSAENRSFRDVINLIADQFGKPRPSRYASKFLSSIIWRLESLRSGLLGTTPLITRDTSRSAHTKAGFDNSKFLRQFPEFSYTSVEHCIQNTCRKLKEAAMG